MSEAEKLQKIEVLGRLLTSAFISSDLRTLLEEKITELLK